MEHVIATLPARVSPEAMLTGAPTALKTGHVNHAVTLFETFCNEEQEQTKVSTLRGMVHLTCQEFQTFCAGAVEMADAADKASGFQPKEGAKGTAKYGPKRTVLNSRLSEARLIFGATKMDAGVTKEVGYWKALAASRSYLDEKGLKWNGERKLSKEEKGNKQVAKLNLKAMEEVMTLYPMQAGESIKDYNERMAQLVDKTIEDLRIEQRNEQVEKIVAGLVEKYPDAEILLAVADRLFLKYEDPSIEMEDGTV